MLIYVASRPGRGDDLDSVIFLFKMCLSVSHFSKSHFTAKITSFYQFQRLIFAILREVVFLQFVPSILLSVVLFNIDYFLC